jgi:hypothetical protein
MALALLQVGLLTKDALVVAQAAREGAREATVTTDESRVREAALSRGALSDERTEVEVMRAGSVGDPVTVRVRYRSPLVVPFVAWLFPDEIEISAETTMRQEADGTEPP